MASMDFKKERANRGLSQKALADLSGLNIRQIQKIEAGEIQLCNITLLTAKKLASALKINIEDLL